MFMNTLIIAEKPSVANRIANAIGGGSEKRKQGEKIGYYEIETKDGIIYVAAAAGHLFTIRQTTSERGYPVLDIEWAPSYEVGKKSEFTKDYLDTLQGLGKKCQRFINACDFDIEGTVIGTNIIKYLEGGKLRENAQRMKFSTTTTEDLLESYGRLTPLDLNNFYAGEARHMLDWLWGINLSRALTQAVHGGSMREMLSIGRVQGPSLGILAKREREISAFVPKPFWRITAVIDGIDFDNAENDFFDQKAAAKSFEESKAKKNDAVVEAVEQREQSIAPYPPFDLTSLQLEASRALHLDPSITLAIAQSLYEKAYISYPRTSSQKLPPTLGHPKIIAAIAKNPEYEGLARNLIAQKRFKPAEGAKTDEAHPAIYPTGIRPAEMSQQETRLYDMITRRFLSVFAENASVARSKVTVAIGSEKYTATGSTILKKGWLEYYTYAKIDERMLPEFKPKTKAKVTKVDMNEMQTQPPKRYTKAGLISELEKRSLGTKATRAQIIDTLIRRRYVEGTSLMVTKFGMSVYETLEKNCEMIVDEKTTERLEEDMEKISKGTLKESEVIDEGKQMLLQAIEQFNKNKEQISAAMKTGLRESSVLGKCPTSGGDLVVRRSRAGKQFVACTDYPKCTQTYSLPQNALIVPTGRTCEHCHTPFIKVIRKGRRPFEMDLDPNCITKKEWAGYKPKAEGGAAPAQAAAPSAEKPKKEKKAKARKPRAVKAKATRKKKTTAPETSEEMV